MRKDKWSGLPCPEVVHKFRGFSMEYCVERGGSRFTWGVTACALLISDPSELIQKLTGMKLHSVVHRPPFAGF